MRRKVYFINTKDYLRKMVRIAVTLFFIITCLTKSFGQKEANVWYFGYKSGLNFNTTPATVLTNGQINTREGVATISDKSTGQLLFYTEGTMVWNRNHIIMPNGSGLQGDFSSTQSSIIVPNPGNQNRYYIFTTAINKGFLYSEVDMTLNGGLGDIRAGVKNIQLISPTVSTEKLIAVRHCNGKDYWVITHTANDNFFHVHLVTATGVQPAVTYGIGSTLRKMQGEYELTGYLKLSPDGSKLANAIGKNMDRSSSPVEIFNFNNATGAITGPVIQLTNLVSPYGVEFSPNEKLIYVTEIIGRRVNQYDLTAANINASQITLASSTNLDYGAVQLGPDGKIYVSAENGYTIGYNYLSTINAPNVPGVGCNYQANSVSLGSTNALIGLPTFNASYLRDTSGFTFQGSCPNATTNFGLTYSGNIDSVKWDFGDASGISMIQNPTHVYGNARIFDVKLIIYRKCNISDTIIRKVNIQSIPNTAINVVLCPNSSYTLPNGTVVTQSGVYPITLRSASGCDSLITTTLNFRPLPNLNLGKDTSLCTGSSIVLTGGSGYTSYLWQNGASSADLTVTTPGLYWLEVKNNDGCSKRDSIVVGSTTALALSLGKDTSICSSQDIVLGTLVSGASSYTWNTGDITPQITVSTPNLYWLEVKTAGGCVGRDTIMIQASPTPQFSLSMDTVLCDKQSITLGNSVNNAKSYLWNTGSVAAQLTTTVPGLYWQQVTNIFGCSKRDSIMIGSKPSPSFNLGADTSICIQQTVILGTAVPGATTYLWNTGATSPQVSTIQTGSYWLEVTNNAGCKARDTINVNANSVSAFILGNDTVVCEGQRIVMSVPLQGVSYLWSDGSTGAQMVVNRAGTFWAEASSQGCQKRDSVEVLLGSSPQVKAGRSNHIDCSRPEARLTASGATKYLWTPTTGLDNPSHSNPVVRINSTITYHLKGTDANGCSGYDSVIVEVTGEGKNTFNMPNAFTPDGDGKNDCFGISKGGVLTLLEFSIYNRFGNSVFTTKNPQDCWDGTYKGRMQDPGGFVYVVRAKSACGNIFKKGIVMLIR